MPWNICYLAQKSTSNVFCVTLRLYSAIRNSSFILCFRFLETTPDLLCVEYDTAPQEYHRRMTWYHDMFHCNLSYSLWFDLIDFLPVVSSYSIIPKLNKWIKVKIQNVGQSLKSITKKCTHAKLLIIKWKSNPWPILQWN